jgi:anti-anti-sigma factor
MTSVDSESIVTPDATRAAKLVRAATKAEIAVRPTGQRVITIALVGEHDLHTAETFEQLALEHLPACDRLTIDLTETTFLDSTILGVLVRIAQHAHWRGVDIRVEAPEAGTAHRLLEVTGLARRLCLVGVRRDSPASEGAAGG